MIRGDLVTHLDDTGCPTTTPSIVLAICGKEAILLESDGSMPQIPLSYLAKWMPPPPGYQWPEEKPHKGINRFGFLRS